MARSDFRQGMLAALCPPLSVWLQTQQLRHVAACTLLCCLGFYPGSFYAVALLTWTAKRTPYQHNAVFLDSAGQQCQES